MSILPFLKMNKEILLLILTGIFICIDLLTIRGITFLTEGLKRNTQIIIYSVFWTATSFVLIFLIYSFANPMPVRSVQQVSRQYFLTGCIALFYIPKLFFIVFSLVDEIIWLLASLLRRFKKFSMLAKERLLLFHHLGWTAAAIVLLTLLHGIVWGRFQYTVEHKSLEFQDLPESFEGFKIVHLSDIHASAFYEHTEKLSEIIAAVNKEKPDLIVITGDFVNYFAEELDGLENIFYRLQAPYGVYAVTGNHDYGDYHLWNTIEEKKSNYLLLMKKLRYLGIRILHNESVLIYRNNECFALAGVDSWGLPPLASYGDPKEALKNIGRDTFTILLSHHPQLWEKKIAGQLPVQLTLSGHTHGMQLGINTGNRCWSPAALIYRHWAGLYEQNQQFLYVNRGLGYIGLPMRINMPAEITVLTLYRKR